MFSKHNLHKEEFRNTFEGEMSKEKLDALRIQTEFLLQLEDQYLSQETKDGRGTQVVG